MKWSEFKALLIGISPETPLGRIVSIRAEEDKEILKYFSREQLQIRSEWRKRQAVQRSKQDTTEALEQLRQAFVVLAEK